MKKLIPLLIFFCSPLARAEGPLFRSSNTITQQEFENVYQDIRTAKGLIPSTTNFLKLSGGTMAGNIAMGNHNITGLNFGDSVGLRATGVAIGGSGAGLELVYSGGGIVQAYDRTASAFQTLTLQASQCQMSVDGGATFPLILSPSSLSLTKPVSISSSTSTPLISFTPGTTSGTSYPVLRTPIGGAGQASFVVERQTGINATTSTQIIHGTSSGLYLVIIADTGGSGLVGIDLLLTGFQTVSVVATSNAGTGVGSRTYTITTGVVSVKLSAGSNYTADSWGLTLVQG